MTELILPTPSQAPPPPSLLHGPRDPPLVDLTLADLLDLQSHQNGHREVLVIPWTGARWTYAELSRQSRQLARALLAAGIGAGDRVGIMAGNCEQYAAVFFAVAAIGGILVILNNTYTATEAMYALEFSGKLAQTSKQQQRKMEEEARDPERQSEKEMNDGLTRVQSAKCSSQPARSAA